jgi:co-chaperonin GroES (HSP10)
MLKPVGKSILFVFFDETIGGWFHEKSAAGLYIPKNADNNAGSCRWAKVVAVGKSVGEHIKPTMNILIEPLKWTVGMEHDGVKIWRTVEECIVAIDEDSIPA